MAGENSVRLLVVEDDLQAVALIRAVLASQRVQFEVVASGTIAEARELLVSASWDAVLLDLSLPDSDGIDTFRSIQNAAPDMPVIVLTGYSNEDLAVDAVHEGAQDYLVKGKVDGDLLSRSILYAIERARILHELRRVQSTLESQVALRTHELSEANSQLKTEIEERLATAERLRNSNVRLERALSDLRESQKQLIQRERLHALSSMASGIAHDFNNALSPILGLTDLLLRDEQKIADPERVRSYLDMIRTSAMSASSVVQRLREFYRVSHISEVFKPLDLNALILRVVEITKPRWHDIAMARGVGIQIHTDLESTPPVLAVEDQLAEVLTNIVINSVEAIEGQGVIQIRSRLRGSHVVLEVEDNGCGMDKEVLRQCMDPFFTTKGKDFTGFGLPTVFGIIERHDGLITMESEPGKGTLVRIKLPASKDIQLTDQKETCEQDSEVPDHSKPLPQNLRILAGDDEPLVRELIIACLKTDGHQVTMTKDGNELIEAFQPGIYDVIITDRAMPGMSGDQVAKILKNKQPDIKIVLLTGFGDLMSATDEKPEGVDIIMSKPFTIDDIRTALTRVITR